MGAGAVGGALASWLTRRGARAAVVVARPGSARAERLAGELGSRFGALASLSTCDVDLLLLAVPDAALAATSELLARRPQAPVALHVAGALGASVLAPLAASGCAVGGFHPLRAFAVGEAEREPVVGLFFALDGAPAAVAMGRRLAAALGGQAAVVPETSRPLYHLIATLLAGGLTTLAATAFEIRRAAGLPAEADPGYALLAADALAAALRSEDPAHGITGPAARGDLETFLTEARSLRDVVPEALPIVLALARETLRQRARIEPESPARNRLRAALDRPHLLDPAEARVLTSGPEPDG